MTVNVVSPIDGSPLAEVETADATAIPALLDRARKAQRSWQESTPETRRGVLLRTASAIRDNERRIAHSESLNTGKPEADTLREVRRAANCFEYYAGWVDHVVGETLPVGADEHVYTLREPVGVVLGIVPWNMPFAFAAKKIAPALAFGNACVLKPAPETPVTALALADLLAAAGAPEGLAQVVVGGGELGAALVAAEGVDLIVFTGSVATGKAIAQSAAANLTPCVLELGGSNAQVVFDDCDLEAAVDGVALGGFGSTGQMCVAGSRVFVHRAVYGDFVDALAARVERLVVGDFRCPGVSMGPQTTGPQRTRTQEAIDDAVRGGARIGAQGGLHPSAQDSEGFYVRPTLFVDVAADSPLMTEEIFGPVVSVAPFTDAEEAVRLVNDSSYGLAAGVWTNDIARAHRIARRLQVGTVWLNTYRVLNDRVPFGGVKNSGYGRENGSSALESYTRPKAVWASLSIGDAHGYSFGK